MENRGSQPQAVVVQRAEYRNIWTQNWLLGHTPRRIHVTGTRLAESRSTGPHG